MFSGSVKELRTYIGKLKMPFKSGTFTNECRKSVNFVHVSDVKFVLKQLLEEMTENNELTNLEVVGQNTLYVSLLGDKGRTSTKLLLQVLNAESQAHSKQYAKMIGIYDSDKGRARRNVSTIDSIFVGSGTPTPLPPNDSNLTGVPKAAQKIKGAKSGVNKEA